jgi:hypothetical protein
MSDADQHADLVHDAIGMLPFAGNVTHVESALHVANALRGKPDTPKLGRHNHKPDILASDPDNGRLMIGEAMTADDLGKETFNEKLADFSTYRVDNERVAFFLIVPSGLAQAASQAIDDHGEKHIKTRVVSVSSPSLRGSTGLVP